MLQNPRCYQLAALAAATLFLFSGCSSDDCLCPGSETGAVAINPSPDGIDAPWTLGLPGGGNETGVGDQVVDGLTPGQYTLTWGDVSDWTKPASETLTLTAGETVTFTGLYLAPGTGAIEIDTSPDILELPWTLTGPDGYSEGGNGDQTITDLVPGDYTVAWGDAPSRTTPPAETQTLASGETISFIGSYAWTDAGTILINPNPPHALTAPWTLDGPDGYSASGTGSQTLTDLDPGDYDVTWGDISGWTTPSPETLSLTAGAARAFNGVYLAPGTSAIVLDPAPDTINAPWTIDSTGSGPFMLLAGDGAETADDILIATDPNSVVVAPAPSALEAPWSMTGPDSYAAAGYGTTTLDDMAPGLYTISWGSVPGWASPEDESLDLVADAVLTFTGTYTYSETYSESGVGDQVLAGLPAGEYTVTWGDVSGWATPAPETLTLAADDILTFSANYTQLDPEFVLVDPATFFMGSAEGEDGRGDDEARHLVTLTRGFYIATTEVTLAWWDEIMGDGSETSLWPKDDLSWDDAVAFCNALSDAEGLTPVYTIDGPDGDVTWDRLADGYRLPTEAEWERACRAGRGSAFASGDIDDIGCDDAVLNAIGWYCGNAGGSTREVGQLDSNDWGLWDMHGNLWEWCWDAYRSDYEELPEEDPVVDGELGDNRVIRGGYWGAGARFCRSASRSYFLPGQASHVAGLRPVRTAP